jgi:hypothetical protein
MLLIALVPLAPLAMRIYAAVASADQASERVHGETILRRAPPPPGARRLGTVAYERRAWDGGGSLTPIASWEFATAYALRRRSTVSEVVHQYADELLHWRMRSQRGACRTYSLPASCDARTVTFTRNGARLVLDLAEYVKRDGRTVTEYGVSVSQ